MRRLWLPLAFMLILGACSSGSDTDGTSGGADGGGAVATEDAGAVATEDAGAVATEDAGGEGSSGQVVNPQPPGQAVASVDGQEYTFNTPGGLACKVTDEEFNFSFRIGDNEVVLGGGASIVRDQWFGSLTMDVFADNDVTTYAAKLNENPSGIAVDGNSVSYSGPMEKYLPAPPGELPEPIDVGDGVITMTCG